MMGLFGNRESSRDTPRDTARDTTRDSARERPREASPVTTADLANAQAGGDRRAEAEARERRDNAEREHREQPAMREQPEHAEMRELARGRTQMREHPQMLEPRPPATPREASPAGPEGRPDAPPREATPASPRRSQQQELAALFTPDVAHQFRCRWDSVQISLVDDPARAVRDADELVAEVLKSLAESFASQRARIEGDAQDISTEDHRQALRRYRSFFQRLLAL